jgi:hypothetical protein
MRMGGMSKREIEILKLFYREMKEESMKKGSLREILYVLSSYVLLFCALSCK